MVTEAVLQEAGPGDGSEARRGWAKGRREVFWLGKQSWWWFQAWQGWRMPGIRRDSRGRRPLQRLQGGTGGMEHSRPPCMVPTQGGAGVVGADSPGGCLALSIPSQGLSVTVAAAPTSRSPAGTRHCSERSAQMHHWLGELLMQDLEISVWVHPPPPPPQWQALLPVTNVSALVL